MGNKKGMEFGFNWIFAVIVGAVILFAAIYAVTKLIGTERTASDTLISAQLSNLLNPIETNLEESKYVTIEFVDETRLYNDCSELGNFGKQQISTASKAGVGEEFAERSVRKTSYNKYIFSRDIEQGEKLHVIVKPFEVPYKVADLNFIYSGRYCFVNPPSDIEDEIGDLSASGNINVGINVSSSKSNCPGNSIVVCFDQLGCDVNVNTGARIVSKNGKDIYYDGPLLYGAIFSGPEIYECQVRRLAKRTGELAGVYASKAALIEGRGCSNNLQDDLISFAQTTNVADSKEFQDNVVPAAGDLRRKNDAISKCKVF